MLSRFSPIFRNSHYFSSPKLMAKSTLISSQKSHASYHIDQTTPIKSSHELAQNNPVLQTKKGTVFQHPSIGKDICEIKDCEYKLCDNPCTDIKQRTYVAHGTHDSTRADSKYVSSTDFNGDARPQYIKAYPHPVENYDTAGTQIDIEKTKELKNNAEMKNNIHMNSSKEPVKSEEIEANEPTNHS